MNNYRSAVSEPPRREEIIHKDNGHAELQSPVNVSPEQTTAEVHDAEWTHVPSGCYFKFPWLLSEGAIHLTIYIYKLVGDTLAVNEYWHDRQYYTLIVSCFCLLAPTLIYTLYMVLSRILEGTPNISDVLTRGIKGLLLIPWQIKGHVDILHFSVDKVMACRKLEPKEKAQIARIKQDTFVLEFFEDFYAGFIQLILQLYLFIISMDQLSKTTVIYAEIAGSTLAVLSLIKAIQLKDDGPISKFLSVIGWMSFAAARTLGFALLAVVIKAWTTLVILLHAVIATFFILKIVYKVHRENAAKGIVSKASKNQGTLVIFCFFLFGLPSLVYWPMMFEFRKKRYVFPFLLATTVQNLIFFFIWFIFKDPSSNHKYGQAFAITLLALTGLSFLFLSLYLYWKPPLTGEVAILEIMKTNANKFGIYYDFVKAVGAISDIRDTDRRIRVIEERRPDLISPSDGEASELDS